MFVPQWPSLATADNSTNSNSDDNDDDSNVDNDSNSNSNSNNGGSDSDSKGNKEEDSGMENPQAKHEVQSLGGNPSPPVLGFPGLMQSTQYVSTQLFVCFVLDFQFCRFCRFRKSTASGLPIWLFLPISEVHSLWTSDFAVFVDFGSPQPLDFRFCRFCQFRKSLFCCSSARHALAHQ